MKSMNDMNGLFKVKHIFATHHFGYKEIIMWSDNVELDVLVKNSRDFHFYIGQHVTVTELYKDTEFAMVNNIFRFQGFANDVEKGDRGENVISFSLTKSKKGKGLDIFHMYNVSVSDMSKYYYGRKMRFAVIFDKD